MIKKLFFLIVALSFFGKINAQSGPPFLSTITASGGYYWYPYNAFRLANGNYVFGTAAAIGSMVPQDGGLISINTNGSLAWSKLYQDFQPLFITENGGSIYTFFFNGGGSYGLSKHNATGTSLFAKSLGTANPNFTNTPWFGKLFKEGVNTAVFYNRQYTNGSAAGIVTKIDASGNSVFSKRIDSLAITDVAQNGPNYVLLARRYNDPSNLTYYVLNVDASLNVIWSKQLDLTQNEYLSLIQIQNNTIYITGNDAATSLVLVGLDLSGNLVLNKSYYSTQPGLTYMQGANLVYKANKLYYFSTRNSGGGYSYTNLTTLNMNGTVVKDRQLSFQLSSSYNSVVVNPDTTAYGIGWIESAPLVVDALQGHFTLQGDLGNCVADSIAVLDSTLTVSLSAPPTFTVSSEPVVFSAYPMINFSSSVPTVNDMKIKIDSISRVTVPCSSPCNGSETVYYSGSDPNPAILWSANSGSQNTQMAMGLCPAVYSVTLTDQYGCTATGTDTLLAQLPATPPICMVTSDSTSTNNIIYWDKTPYLDADSFIVYREVTSNVFKRVGAVSVDSLSMFMDTDRSIGPSNGDPNLTTYHYKLAIRDTCGTEGPMGPSHTSIYFNDLLNGSFTWNTYTVENMTVTPVTTFELLRDSNNTGFWKVVATAPGTSNVLADPQYFTFQFVANWRVQANGLVCTPTMRYANNSPQGTVVRSKSNITNNRTTGIQKTQTGVSLFPNPAKDMITINYTEELGLVRIYNSLGQPVYENKCKEKTHVLNLAGYAPGIYFLEVQGKHTRFVKE